MAQQRPFEEVEQRLEAYRARFMGRHLKAFLDSRPALLDQAPAAPPPPVDSSPELERRSHPPLTLTIAEPNTPATHVSIAPGVRVAAPAAESLRLALASDPGEEEPTDLIAASAAGTPEPAVAPPRERRGAWPGFSSLFRRYSER